VNSITYCIRQHKRVRFETTKIVMSVVHINAQADDPSSKTVICFGVTISSVDIPVVAIEESTNINEMSVNSCDWTLGKSAKSKERKI